MAQNFQFAVISIQALAGPKDSYLVSGTITESQIRGSFEVGVGGLNRGQIKTLRESFVALGVKKPEAASKANRAGPQIRRFIEECRRADF